MQHPIKARIHDGPPPEMRRMTAKEDFDRVFQMLRDSGERGIVVDLPIEVEDVRVAVACFRSAFNSRIKRDGLAGKRISIGILSRGDQLYIRIMDKDQRINDRPKGLAARIASGELSSRMRGGRRKK